MKANFKFPLTVNKRSVEFPNSTAMRISICNALTSFNPIESV